MKQYKAVITVPYGDGTYADVGMNMRTMFSANSIYSLYKKGRKYAESRRADKFRIELFHANDFYKSEPFRTEYMEI